MRDIKELQSGLIEVSSTMIESYIDSMTYRFWKDASFSPVKCYSVN